MEYLGSKEKVGNSYLLSNSYGSYIQSSGNIYSYISFYLMILGESWEYLRKILGGSLEDLWRILGGCQYDKNFGASGRVPEKTRSSGSG